MTPLSYHSTRQLFEHAANSTIAIIGDVMLDRYFIGDVTRVSPEAPVPVIDIQEETWHLGGAANVANNIVTLGGNAMLCGVLGNDNSSKVFLDIAEESGIQTQGLIIENNRPTTVKTRIMGNNQHIARLDREVRTPILTTTADSIIEQLTSCKNLTAVLFEDYNKGVLTEYVIERVREFALKNNVPMFVDPKIENFLLFQKATVFKPNKIEAQHALGFTINTEEDITRAGVELLKKLDAQYILLTLGAKGMRLFAADGTVSSVPTFALNVADVSGAGDTAIATLAFAIAAGATAKEAAVLANIAAGVVCGIPGVVSITKEALLAEVERRDHKILGI